MYPTQLCRSEARGGPHGTKVKVLTGLSSSLEALVQNPFLCFFWLPEAACIPWLMAPSSIFKAKNIRLSSYPAISVVLWPQTEKIFCLRGLLWFDWPHLENQGHAPISRSLILIVPAKSLCQVNSYIHKFWGSGCWHLCGVAGSIILPITAPSLMPQALPTQSMYVRDFL